FIAGRLVWRIVWSLSGAARLRATLGNQGSSSHDFKARQNLRGRDDVGPRPRLAGARRRLVGTPLRRLGLRPRGIWPRLGRGGCGGRARRPRRRPHRLAGGGLPGPLPLLLRTALPRRQSARVRPLRLCRGLSPGPGLRLTWAPSRPRCRKPRRLSQLPAPKGDGFGLPDQASGRPSFHHGSIAPPSGEGGSKALDYVWNEIEPLSPQSAPAV